MTRRTRIRNLVLIRHFGGDEIERVTSDIDVCDRLRNFRHVTPDAIAARAARAMMRVGFDACGVRPIRRGWAMAGEADLIRGFDQVRVVFRTVHVVATEASHTAPIHQALDEIVSLHPIFVRRSVGKMHEVCLAQFMFFEPPKIPQV